jgi:hypothetical protein
MHTCTHDAWKLEWRSGDAFPCRRLGAHVGGNNKNRAGLNLHPADQAMMSHAHQVQSGRSRVLSNAKGLIEHHPFIGLQVALHPGIGTQLRCYREAEARDIGRVDRECSPAGNTMRPGLVRAQTAFEHIEVYAVRAAAPALARPAFGVDFVEQVENGQAKRGHDAVTRFERENFPAFQHFVNVGLRNPDGLGESSLRCLAILNAPAQFIDQPALQVSKVHLPGYSQQA